MKLLIFRQADIPRYAIQLVSASDRPAACDPAEDCARQFQIGFSVASATNHGLRPLRGFWIGWIVLSPARCQLRSWACPGLVDTRGGAVG
jgi:hypothetical protein